MGVGDLPAYIEDQDLRRHPLAQWFRETGNWSEKLEVEEAGLKEYLRLKKHGLMFKTAAVKLAYTLAKTSLSGGADGFIRCGDTFTLLNRGTSAKLQCDIASSLKFKCPDLVYGKEEACRLITSARILVPCLRNTWSVSYVDDSRDSLFRYGRPVRIHANLDLAPPGEAPSGRPAFLYTDRGLRPGDVSDIEPRAHESIPVSKSGSRVVLFPRTSPNTIWRAWPPLRQMREKAHGKPVLAGDKFVLEHVASGELLMSDEGAEETEYGQEHRVVAYDWIRRLDEGADAEHLSPRSKEIRSEKALTEEAAGNVWEIQAIVEESDDGKAMHDDFWDMVPSAPQVTRKDLPGLPPRVVAAQRHSQFAILEKIVAKLKSDGMHGVRSFRKICSLIDLFRNGTAEKRSFEGALAWVGVKLPKEEFAELVEFLEVKPGSGTLDYTRIFGVMQPGGMEGPRLIAVQDAFSKLRDLSGCGLVEVRDVQRFADVSALRDIDPTRSDAELLEELLGQFDPKSADGSISWEEFRAYYADVSMAVDNDVLFVELVRRTWSL